MKNNSEHISEEIKEFYEYVNPNECSVLISKLFFKYCADKSPDEFVNMLSTEQVKGIHEILSFICNNNRKNQGELINSILPLKNRINQRTGLNEIFFHSLSKHWEGEDFVELEEIRIIKDLFELLNNLEILREPESLERSQKEMLSVAEKEN